MRRGLVIGKFLPIHEGHIALINFAATQCDELIVSMSYTAEDVIDPQLRFSWIKEIFGDRPNIKPAMIKDNFDNDSLPLDERTKIWAEVIRKTYPPIDIVFSSEAYGYPFAKNLNAEHIDYNRIEYPVSATSIREHPFRYWKYIPVVVRPFFVKKICFYGPESTGKTSMTESMAAKYQTEFVPEVARELLITNDFTVDEIIKIGGVHYERLLQKVKTANKILLCDTDAITTQIYSQYYLGVIPPALFELEAKVQYDHYFLFDIDVSWVPDGLRDLPHKREEMFKIFKDALEQRKLPYTIVKGSWREREQVIMQQIDKILAD